MKLYAIRHPKPLGAEGLCYGQSDLAVSPNDLLATAAKLQGLLVDKPIDCWLSSPLQRCESLTRALTDDFRCDDRLLEMHFGEWESLSWDDIDRQAFDDWMIDYVNQAPPGGESFGAVQRRVSELLAELKASGLTGEA
ncbi:MAG: histidine phosphatase family protein, partial [Coriobacteriia bacterium]|nr:histidine phosphatase family protein [Coriobacteriia bacterium]